MSRVDQAQRVSSPECHTDGVVDEDRLAGRGLRAEAEPGAVLVPGLRPGDPNRAGAAERRRSRGSRLRCRSSPAASFRGGSSRRSCADGGRRQQEPGPGTGAALAAEAFVMLAQAEEYVGLLEGARETVAAHVELARDYVEQGMLVRSEFLRAEVELARVDDLLEEAGARPGSRTRTWPSGSGRPGHGSSSRRCRRRRRSATTRRWVARDRGGPRATSRRRGNCCRAGELEEKVRKAAYLPKVGVAARADCSTTRLSATTGTRRRSWRSPRSTSSQAARHGALGPPREEAHAGARTWPASPTASRSRCGRRTRRRRRPARGTRRR